MPGMIVPKSSHDRSCSKKSSPNARSIITISESVWVWCFCSDEAPILVLGTGNFFATQSEKTHNPQIHDLVVNKCLNLNFELSAHRSRFIFILNAIAFQSASIEPTPVNHFSGRIGETRFWVQNIWKTQEYNKNKCSEVKVLGCGNGIPRCRLCSHTLCHQFQTISNPFWLKIYQILSESTQNPYIDPMFCYCCLVLPILVLLYFRRAKQQAPKV